MLIFAFSLITPGITAQDTCHDHHQMDDSSLMERQQMIHARSPMVMPFDMNKVTHYFIKTSDGGVLMIKVKDPGDTKQVSLIRKHLKKEQKLFSEGDFNDPKTLHGMDMPGVKTLSESKDKLDVDYKPLSRGAKLTFASNDSTVIHAVHTWFDAQLKDHGKDARSEE